MQLAMASELVRTRPIRAGLRSNRPHKMLQIEGGIHKRTFSLKEANSILSEGDWFGDGTSLLIRPFAISATPVTNSEFQEFIQAGGYFRCEYWPELIHELYLETDLVGMERVLMFVDVTNCLGPAYWSRGACLPGTSNDPVEGVCWYEAMAYARWRGLRLPREEEWLYAFRELGDQLLPLVHQMQGKKERRIPSSRRLARLDLPSLVSEWMCGD